MATITNTTITGTSIPTSTESLVVRIVDLKCPGSGECEKNLWSNLEHLTARDELKFVLANRGDYEWARGVIGEKQLDRKAAAVLLSCVQGELDPAAVAKWMLED